MGNDATGQYMAAREAGNLSPAQQRRQQQDPKRSIQKERKQSFNFSPGAVVRDVARGVVELPRQVVGGVRDATQETVEFAGSLGEWLNENVADLGQLSDVGIGDDGDEFSLPVVTEPSSVTGNLIRSASQFLAGFAGAGKLPGFKGATTTTGKVAQVSGRGAVADATVFDPHEARLSDLIQEQPSLANPVNAFLASDPVDTEAEGRFKNALEGLGLGLATDGLLLAAKGIRSNRIRKRETERLAATRQQADTITQVDEVSADKELVPDSDAQSKPEPKELAFTVGEKKADAERALNINMDHIESTDDVKSLIEDVGVKLADDINLDRREVVTNEQTKLLADDLGMTVDDLLSRRRGEAFNAEQAVAARRILIASGESVIEAAKKASGGADEDVLKFRRIMAQHAAIQKQVSGATAEAGRALQSFNIPAEGGKMRQRLINEAVQGGGGREISQKMARMISELETGQQLNQFTEQASKATTKDMLIEAWINSLLSGPQTHVVNVLGNSLTALWNPAERVVARSVGAARGDETIVQGEVTASLFGMVQGAKDGMKLAWHAMKTGEPTDPIAKIETQEFKAITGENLGLSGPMGRFADYMGEIIRIPGRFLMSSDEFFKSVGYRTELHAQAFRMAKSEGLQGGDMAARIKQILNDPPENLQLDAVDAARYQTFTKPLGEIGQAIQKVPQKSAAVKLLVPFIRTPTNIIKYVGERTPLAALAPSIKTEIAAGGVRKDMALARIAVGSVTMMAAMDYTLTGQVTGGGPKNPAMKNVLRATGWQPYSIKIDDTYYAYNRLDPVGATIGLSADIAEIMGETGDVDALDLATASVVAVGQNVSSKTYLSGLSQFFDVMANTSSDPEANNFKARQWLARFAGTVVPTGVAQVERVISPELSATYDILDKIKSRIPGYSDDLPPRRNIFGEPIILSGGLGPDIMSPVYTSTDKKDFITDEIVKQKTVVRMPNKTLSGVRLTPQEYDRLVVLYSGEDATHVSMTLRQRLERDFATSSYQQATDGQQGGKSLRIKTIFSAYKQAAQAQLIKESAELRARIEQNKTEQVQALAGDRFK